MTADVTGTERKCLDEAIAPVKGMRSHDPHRVRAIRLQGSYPGTRIVVTGDRSVGGEWRVSFPIWDSRAGGTIDGEPVPGFVGTLVLTEVPGGVARSGRGFVR